MHTAASIGLGVTAALAAALLGATASAEPQVVRFAVRVFEAGNPLPDPGAPDTRPQPVPIEPRLAPSPDPDAPVRFILGRLRRLFRYTEYRKVAQLRAEGPLGTSQSFEFPGNCSLEITPERLLDDRVQMRVLLREGGRVGLHTGLVAPPDTPAVLGGPPHGDGVLVIVFWARPARAVRPLR